MWQQLVKEIACGFITLPASIDEARAVAHVFLGPKRRLCFNPEEAKELSEPRSVSYPKPGDILASPEASCGVKADIKSAYRHLKLAYDDAIYMAIEVDGMLMIWNRIPFGIRHGPAWFVDTFALDTQAFTQSKQGRVTQRQGLVTMMDDMATWAAEPAIALTYMLDLIEWLSTRGWVLSVEKCFLRPARVLLFLGVLVDFEQRAVKLFPPKVVKLRDWVGEALHYLRRYYGTQSGAPASTSGREKVLRSRVARWQSMARANGWETGVVPESLYRMHHDVIDSSLDDGAERALPKEMHARLQKITGMISWFSTVYELISLWRRPLDSMVASRKASLEGVVTLGWWYDALADMASWPPVRRGSTDPELVAFGDASATGFGAVVPENGLWIAGTLSEVERRASSSAREAIPLVRSIQEAVDREVTFRSIAYNSDATVLRDSFAKGNPRELITAMEFREAAVWRAAGMNIRVTWRSREDIEMKLPDALSGAIPSDGMDWRLKPAVAASLWKWSGGWDIDSFASQESALADRYASHFPPESLRTAIIAECQEKQQRTGSMVQEMVGYLGGAEALRYRYGRVRQYMPTLLGAKS